MFDDKLNSNSCLSKDEVLHLAHLSANNVDEIAGKLHSVEQELQRQRELLSNLNKSNGIPSGDVHTYGEQIRSVRVEVARLEDEFNKLYREALEKEMHCDALEEVARHLGINETFREEERLAPKNAKIRELSDILDDYQKQHEITDASALFEIPLLDDILGSEKLKKRPQSFYDDIENNFNAVPNDDVYLTKEQLIERLKKISHSTDNIIRSLREIESDLNRQKELLSYLDRATGVDENNKVLYDEARRQVENNISSLEDECSSLHSKIKTIERQLDIYASVASWLGDNNNYREEKRFSSFNTDIEDDVTNLKMRIILTNDELSRLEGYDDIDRRYIEDDYDKISLPEFFARFKEVSKTADIYVRKIHTLEKEIERDKELLTYLNNAANITEENKAEYERLKTEIPLTIKRLSYQAELLRPRALKAEFVADVYEKVARWLGDDSVYRHEERLSEVGDISEAVEALKKRIRRDGYLYKGSIEDYKKGYVHGYEDASRKYKGHSGDVVSSEDSSASTMFNLPHDPNADAEVVKEYVEVKKKRSPLWIVLTFLLLLGLGGLVGYYQGYVVKNYDKTVDSLNGTITDLNTETDNLNSTIGSLNNENASLNGTIEGLNDDVDVLTSENEKLKQENEELLSSLGEKDSANSELLTTLALLKSQLEQSGDENLTLMDLLKKASELQGTSTPTTPSEKETDSSSTQTILPSDEKPKENIWAINSSIGLTLSPYGFTNYRNFTLNRSILNTYGFGFSLDYRMNFKYMFIGLEGGMSWFIKTPEFTSITALLKFGGIIPLSSVVSLQPYIGVGLNFASSYGTRLGLGFEGGLNVDFKVHKNVSLSLGAVLKGGYGYNSYNDKVLSLDFHAPSLSLNIWF